MRKCVGIVFTLFVGFVVGSLMGLMYAPKEGTQIRKRLSFQFSRYKEILEEMFWDLLHGKVLVDNSARQSSQELVKKTKEKAEKLLDDVDGIMKKVREKGGQTKKGKAKK